MYRRRLRRLELALAALLLAGTGGTAPGALRTQRIQASVEARGTTAAARTHVPTAGRRLIEEAYKGSDRKTMR